MWRLQVNPALGAGLFPFVVDCLHESRRGIDDSLLRVLSAIEIEKVQEAGLLVLRRRRDVVSVRFEPVVCGEEAREPIGVFRSSLFTLMAGLEILTAGMGAEAADTELLPC